MASYDNTTQQGTTGAGMGGAEGVGMEGTRGSEGGQGLRGTGAIGEMGGLGGQSGVGETSNLGSGSVFTEQTGSTTGMDPALQPGTHSHDHPTTHDPITHQAAKVARHPGAAAAHPAHPVEGAEMKGAVQGETGAGGYGQTGAGVGTGTAAGTGGMGTGSTAKDTLKHPVAAASHPSHPGLAAAAKDDRKGGHLTSSGAAHDPLAPTPADASATRATGMVGAAPPSSAHGHEHPHAPAAAGAQPHKVTLGEKVAGTAEALVGKLTHSPAMVEEGNVKKSQGAEAARAVHEANKGPAGAAGGATGAGIAGSGAV
ncbi:hypothetical protein JCM10207_001427 [Rhodosporidiobolus poonsookiae]